jgi:hypothetical protein
VQQLDLGHASDRGAVARYGQVLQPVPSVVQNVSGVPVAGPLQPALQVMLVASHDAASRQVTSHEHAAPQLIVPPHAALPVQLTLHAPVPQARSLPHAPGPPQVRSQAPRPHVTFLQVWRPLHAIVHDVALPQLTPLLHWLATEHSTLQLQLAGQLIARLHAPLLSAQSIVQVFWARSHDVHCDGQTAASPGGSAVSGRPESATTTQNPSTQVRPSAQRCPVSHAKSPLR